ncbi:HesA/MoeB/ThiF family protein [uncultured Planktosalinus sp.]|uniref:HesA/MoeB/ThiF family protein n=1 Tax=uncultured Planktosalinus sp. TaxID=1810935 RepID=UPI0030DB66C8
MNTKNRYQRQLQLTGFGKKAQDKLAVAKILLIGAGGLGCPALQYLAGAGVGTLGIVDFDTVSITNLHRQTLFTTADIGKSKVEVAAKRLKALNPEISIMTYPTQLTNQNAFDIIKDYDLVIDGSDNFSTRYLVNDACVLLNKPLIYGAVMRFEGQVGVFNLENNNLKTNYRDLFPTPPDAVSASSCNEVGVLGVLPGIIGTWQASEAIKIITGIGTPLVNKILTLNLLNNKVYEFQLTKNNQLQKDSPKDKNDFLSYNYDWFCNKNLQNIITVEAFDKLRKEEDCSIIDVRETGDTPIISEFETQKLPFSCFRESISDKKLNQTVVLLCQSGQRSLKALELLKKQQPSLKVFSLEGGITEWKKHNKSRQYEQSQT